MTATIYRVQDANGRGPWKPGFSSIWVEEKTAEQCRRLQAWFLELGPVHLDALEGSQVACGCTCPEHLREWFSPTEYEKLQAFGYQAVTLTADRILGDGLTQVVFERALPISQGAKPFDLYPGGAS